MDLLLIALSGFAATILMTFFSYLMDAVSKSNFREPQLLNQLISGSQIIPVEVKKTSILGWIIHFIIGIFFAAAFYLLTRNFGMPVNFFSGLIFGAAAGVLGISSWWIMFKLSANAPPVNLPSFFLHLFFAHIIFGWTLTITYYLYV